MIDIKLIRENPEKIEKAALSKGVKVDLGKIVNLDQEKRKLLAEVEKLRSERNTLTAKLQIARGEATLKQAGELKTNLKEKEDKLATLDKELTAKLLEIPNPPAEDVKVGKDESENEVIKTVGEKTKFDFDPVDYMVLGEKLNLIDTERAAKVSGSRFGYLKNEAVLLEFALIQFGLKTLLAEGFHPVVPPVLVKEDVMSGMGYLEHGGKEESYYLDKDRLYLVGTAEQSVVPMHRDEVLDLSKPIRYVGFSTAFRREAGSYGKDTRGILRVHQFDKLEMVSFTTQEKGDQEHDFLLSLEEKLMQSLGLPYQVVKMCTGDLGLPATRKYDIETWIPSEGKYRETHSASTTTDYQARRLNIKYRQGNDLKYAHILNGTAFAIGRTLITIFENYQQKDGSINIPEVLRPYVGLDQIRSQG